MKDDPDGLSHPARRVKATRIGERSPLFRWIVPVVLGVLAVALVVLVVAVLVLVLGVFPG